MVNAVIIHTVSDSEMANPVLCYWEPYGFLAQNSGNVENVSAMEKEVLNFIMARVQDEYLFRKQVASMQEQLAIERGIFRLTKNSLFPYNYRVQWQACYGCAFVMVLSENENIPLAEHILGMIVGYATNIFNMLEDNYKQMIAYPDKMVALLHVFLPSGQIQKLSRDLQLHRSKLIFMNHRLVKQYEKELDKILSEKK